MKIVLQKKDNWNGQFRPFSLMEDIQPKIENLEGYLAIGSFEFLENCKKKGATVFEDKEWFKYSYYAKYFGDQMLNRDYCLIPAGELSRLQFSLLGQYGNDCKIFVRPDSGKKIFTGTLLDIEEFSKFSTEFYHDLVVVSSPKNLVGEWRFAVSNRGDILGVSLYRFQGNLVSVPVCPPEMTSYVLDLLKRLEEFPDTLFTIDIACLDNKQFRVIECNAFSSSGLYDMKPEAIKDFIYEL